MNKIGDRSVRPKRLGSYRRGIVLIVVMVVVVMISLAGFGFVATMSNENRAVHLRGEQLQMESAIASAEEFLKLYLERPPVSESTSQHASTSTTVKSEEEDDGLMRGVVVADEDGPHSRIRFTIIAPRYDETGTAAWRYGLERESSRIDLHVVMDWEAQQAGAGRRALMALPGMTEAIADAILDWMDGDNTPRQSGAEMDYYATQNPPYAPRNGIPDSLEELLLIKGVTRSLLFGRDANQNHRLDLEEQSSGLMSSGRDSSGERQIPWIELLTLYSGERNLTREGKPRINLNQFDLGQLHRQLTTAFDLKFATYVVLYRQFGPFAGSGPAVDAGKVAMNLTLAPRFLFRTPLDLVQSRVQVQGPAGIVSLVESPLQGEREKLNGLLGILCDRVALSNDRSIRGRVNVNSAPAEVLRAIPGLDKALAEQIVTSRTSTTKPDQRHEEHSCWLLTEGLVDLKKMKELFPYLTVGGDVYRAQIVAFSETSRLSQRVEVVLDASRPPTRRVFWKDLQILGRVYPWDMLDTPGGISAPQSGASDAAFIGN
jgi:hypothetical protein